MKGFWGVFFMLLLPLPLKAQEGGRLYEKGLYQEAAEYYLAQALKKKKKAGVYYYNAARSYHQDYREKGSRNSLDKAVEGYYAALALDPGLREARVNLELARREQEERQDQESPPQKAQGQDSNSQDKDPGKGANSQTGPGKDSQKSEDGQTDQGKDSQKSEDGQTSPGESLQEPEAESGEPGEEELPGDIQSILNQERGQRKSIRGNIRPVERDW